MQENECNYCGHIIALSLGCSGGHTPKNSSFYQGDQLTGLIM